MSALGELATIRKGGKQRATRAPSERNDGKAAVFFLAPWFVGLALIVAGPLIASLYLSFTDYNLLQNPNFIGLDNYAAMLEDPRLRSALVVTFTYVFVSVPLQLAAALGLALLLDRGMRGLAFYRSAFYLPSLLGSSVAIAILWRQIFGTEGLINQVLGRRGETPLACVGDVFRADLTLISNLRELDFYPQRPATRYCLAAAPAIFAPMAFTTDKPRLVAYLKPEYPGFAQVVAALRQLEAEVIAICPMAPAGSLEQWQLPHVRFTRDLVNLPALLAQADVFIGHGNAGTVRESLVARTPVLVLPIQLEQWLAGKRLAALGVGVMLEGEPDSQTIAATLADMVQQVALYQRAIDPLLATYERPYTTVSDQVLAFCAARLPQ